MVNPSKVKSYRIRNKALKKILMKKRRGSITLHLLQHFNRIENRARSLDCCILEAYSKKM